MGERPSEVLVIHQRCCDHQVALAITLERWSDHLRLGSNWMPRYLYEVTIATVCKGGMIPCCVGFWRVSGEGHLSCLDWGKSITATFDSSKGEL